VGTNADEAHTLLQDANFITAESLDEAAAKAVAAGGQVAKRQPAHA
jgi:succinyl-CoA synthetase beta subunit